MRQNTRPWRRWFGDLTNDARPRQLHAILARDGVELALWRVGSARGEPVLLLHGLGSNRLGFDWPGRSFAAWLAERGYDVFLPELRGHGASERPSSGWTLDDYLAHDLPAVLDAITEMTGYSQTHWVGHSMGGLLWFLLATHGDPQAVRSAIAVGSALDYRPGASGFRSLLGLKPLARRLPSIPYGRLMHWLAPTFGRAHASPDAFNVHPSNVEARLNRRLHANAFETIPTSLLEQLSSAFDDSGLASRDGAICYLQPRRRLTTPTLLVAGSRDPQATLEAVRASAEQLGEHARVLELGRSQGCRDEYGHWDLLVGRRAQREVWPRLLGWLEQHPIPAPGRPAISKPTVNE
ncbi:MAG: alpha/beta hydrolase [Myxococcales bacterium]|nr:alpha/beta hydrolase [Myxococcales bacterium]